MKMEIAVSESSRQFLQQEKVIMDRNQLFCKITAVTLLLAFTVCMSGCKGGKSDTGDATSETALQSEYSESSSENSTADSERFESNIVSSTVTDISVKSITAPKITTSKKSYIKQTQTTAKSTALEQKNAPAADTPPKNAAESTAIVTTKPVSTAATESPTHGRDENELPGIDPFA